MSSISLKPVLSFWPPFLKAILGQVDQQLHFYDTDQNYDLKPPDIVDVVRTHWLWEIATMILKGSAEYNIKKKQVAMLDIPVYERADELPSPRVLNSHNYFRHLPRQLVEKRIKTIHIMRNPKDVSVSFYHHLIWTKQPIGFEGTYSEFADLFMKGKAIDGCYFDYIKDWQTVEKEHSDLPIFTLFYEDLKKEPIQTIKTVAEFLNQPISDELCGKIAEACSFTKLKKADKEIKESLPKEPFFKEGYTMYRKGEIGDWKNWLTVAQNEAFDEVIERELKDTGIKFKYS